MEMAGAVEGVDADVAELRSLLAARFGVDDRGPLGAPLPDPEAARVLVHRRGGKLAQQLGFEPLGALMQDRGDGVVERGRHRPEHECRNHRRRHELPRGDAGSARNDQLEAPREREVARHRAHQHGERHDALGELRDAEKRDLGEEPRGRVGPVGAAAHELDIVDHRRQARPRRMKEPTTELRKRSPK